MGKNIAQKGEVDNGSKYVRIVCMKKVCFILALSLSFSLVFVSCGSKKIKGDFPVTLVMAEMNPEDTVVGRMDKAFKEKVEELSGGSIKIDIQYSGILGDEKQIMKIIMEENSSIQLVRGPANLSSYSKGKKVKSAILSVPYTFKDDLHFWKFANSAVANEILDEPYKLGLGVKGLFYGQEGLRHYFSTQKIESVEDLKGKKMRVSGKVLTALAKDFGSEPIEVKFTDLYAAFQTGKVEVAEQPITNYLSNSFNQVAPYLILDGHMLGAVSVMINSKCWDSLSKNQQKILVEAGRFASDHCRKIMDETISEAVKKLREEGVVITEVSDAKPWQKACSNLQAEAYELDGDLYQKILDMAE